MGWVEAEMSSAGTIDQPILTTVTVMIFHRLYWSISISDDEFPFITSVLHYLVVGLEHDFSIYWE